MYNIKLSTGPCLFWFLNYEMFFACLLNWEKRDISVLHTVNQILFQTIFIPDGSTWIWSPSIHVPLFYCGILLDRYYMEHTSNSIPCSQVTALVHVHMNNVASMETLSCAQIFHMHWKIFLCARKMCGTRTDTVR